LSANPYIAAALEGSFKGNHGKHPPSTCGRRYGSTGLSPAVPAWKLKGDILNIFFCSQEVTTQKP
jgi:hypothetical protein